jgi:hypothetical protein
MLIDDEALERFERGEVDPAAFPHRAHVQVAHALMLRHSFPDALPRMAHGIRTMAVRAGKPEVYNETITTAFLSLVADRLVRNRREEFDTFEHENPDLFDKGALLKLYSPERLTSAEARATFLLPDMPQVAG